MTRKKVAAPRHKVTVEIAGEKHVLRSDVSPEYTRAVAAHLDGVIRALPDFPALEPHRAAILAALAITDELFRARDEAQAALGASQMRAAAMAAQLATLTDADPFAPDSGSLAPDEEAE